VAAILENDMSKEPSSASAVSRVSHSATRKRLATCGMASDSNVAQRTAPSDRDPGFNALPNMSYCRPLIFRNSSSLSLKYPGQ
jgi:hypothetical protein